MSDPLSAIIDRIYDSVLDAATWPDTLTHISSYIGASFMSVVPYDDPSGIYMSRGGEHAMQSYTSHWHKYDTMVKVGIQNKHTRSVLCDWTAIGADKIKRNSYYQEYRRESGIWHCLGSTFEAVPGGYYALGINLPTGRGPLDSYELETVERVLMHAGKAIAVTSQISALRSDVAALEDIFEQLRFGAAIVDATGDVIISNRNLCHYHDNGLTIRDKKLICTMVESQRGLDHAIRNASGQPDAREDDFVLIARPSGRRPLMVRLIPLSQKSNELLWGSRPKHKRSLLVVVDLEQINLIARSRDLQVFGLTAAEAKVATLVGGGLSPRECAAELDVSEGTIRSQLKQVYSKMDLHRQSDLVRLVARLERTL